MTLEEAIRKAREVHESHAEMVWTAKYLREVIDALEPFYGDSYDEVSRSYEKLP